MALFPLDFKKLQFDVPGSVRLESAAAPRLRLPLLSIAELSLRGHEEFVSGRGHIRSHTAGAIVGYKFSRTDRNWDRMMLLIVKG